MAFWKKVATFAAVFISRIPKYRQRPDGTIEKYDYYRLSENWRDADGKIRKRTVVNIGELPGYTKAGRKELGALLEELRRIAGAQVMVTTRMETVKGETVEIRQATEEEQELARIYSLLDITPLKISQLHWPPLQCGPSSTAHGGEGVDVRKRPPGSHFG